MKASFFKHTLNFTMPGKTSRDVLSKKDSWFLVLKKNENYGVGECSIIPRLSLDNVDQIESELNQLCKDFSMGNQINIDKYDLFPALKFSIETAFLSLKRNNSPFHLFDSDFTNKQKGIFINGLIWMGDIEFMEKQIRIKLKNGFNCLKLKIGGLDFETEMSLIKKLRQKFSPDDLEIRLDANGAFCKNNALEKLERLGNFSIHSIEQPIMPNQQQEMAKLCELSPIPIALDEELIGVNLSSEREKLLDTINPHFLIVKPSLLGGFKDSNEWIHFAEKRNIKWWATSALESNVGLNSIAQWVSTKNNELRQGLGTGMLFSNNIQSPLCIEKDAIFLKEHKKWDLNFFTRQA